MIEREDQGRIAVVRLAHRKASAMDLELVERLTGEARALERDGVDAVVLTGSGSIFSAGVDLYRIIDGGADYVARFLPALTTMLRVWFEFPKPLVAAINGHAIAGGAILAQCADLRLMASGKGRIGIPELRVGVPFPPYVIELLRQRVSPHALQRLIVTG
ncbi:MAG TPA: enoyl-CoA hydratase/isomerase family protein, partial [Thermoanaerobaculia bacterium]|nr:enoyl-CoA hydratase/isomerase family protein [Thermoanaerobaculia bacterium]